MRPKIPYSIWGQCLCDGNGFCLNSRHLGGRFKASRCTCSEHMGCFHIPLARWKAAAWTVILVLKLRATRAGADADDKGNTIGSTMSVAP